MLSQHLILSLFLASGRVLVNAAQSPPVEDYDVLQYIDPLIGSANGGKLEATLGLCRHLLYLTIVFHIAGNVFPGASLPYGMAKAGADTNSDSNQGGFAYDGSNVTGFSSMHDSGTGGSPSLGNFPLFPYAQCKDDDVNGCAYPKKSRATPYTPGSVQASPGYFALSLESDVDVEMTAAQHTSLFRFTFPEDSNPLILLDLSDLSDSRQDNASISIDEYSGRMTGSGRFLPSFGSGAYTLHFCADFQSTGWLRDSGVFVDARASTDVHDLTISRSINGYPLPVSKQSDIGSMQF
jgi:hypothetical protein